MKHILIIGAGKSTGVLVEYLQEKSKDMDLQLSIADRNLEAAQRLAGDHDRSTAIEFDVFDNARRPELIQSADLVISMLPARFHIEVARDCVSHGKPMVTASYVSEEMRALDKQARDKGIILLNEIGVDPGIDHMSAMQVIDGIKDKGGKIILFESFTGGLVAPEHDDNLWHYKFTWNPRNVVVAGQGGVAEFVQEGQYKYIPYHRLFRRTEFLKVDGYGVFEAYANRNSLQYQDVYDLPDVLTLYRGTMRRVGYSRAWNIFVQLGMTDDSFIMKNSHKLSNRDFINAFLPYHPTDSVELKLRHALKIDQDDIVWEKLLELDLFSKEKVPGLHKATPAQMLQSILQEKWTLGEDDKDMIVMYHKFGYEINGETKQIDSTMVSIGHDQTRTAMARTVGLPVAMAAVRILTGEITLTGVQIPLDKQIYVPILKELEDYGIRFRESEMKYVGYNPDAILS